MVMAEATAKFKRGVAKPSSARGTRTGCRRSKARSEEFERFAEVGYHFVPQHMVPSPIRARVEENPQAKACRHTGFHIADLVTQDRTLRGIQTKVRDRLQDHARLGLAPRMLAAVRADTVHRMIGTIIDAGYRGLLRCKPIAHPTCQILVSLLVEAATANAGLIGDDDDLPAQLVGPETSQFENAGNKFELVGPMNVAAVHVDHPIAIKKKRTGVSDHGNLTGCATASGGTAFWPHGPSDESRCRKPAPVWSRSITKRAAVPTEA